MGHKAKATEHTGAKHGRGAYWGRKADAKAESNSRRRQDDKTEAALIDAIETAIEKHDKTDAARPTKNLTDIPYWIDINPFTIRRI